MKVAVARGVVMRVNPRPATPRPADNRPPVAPSWCGEKTTPWLGHNIGTDCQRVYIFVGGM